MKCIPTTVLYLLSPFLEKRSPNSTFSTLPWHPRPQNTARLHFFSVSKRHHPPNSATRPRIPAPVLPPPTSCISRPPQHTPPRAKTPPLCLPTPLHLFHLYNTQPKAHKKAQKTVTTPLHSKCSAELRTPRQDSHLPLPHQNPSHSPQNARKRGGGEQDTPPHSTSCNTE